MNLIIAWSIVFGMFVGAVAVFTFVPPREVEVPVPIPVVMPAPDPYPLPPALPGRPARGRGVCR